MKMKDARDIIFPDFCYFQFRDKIEAIYPENVLLILDEKGREYLYRGDTVYRLKALKNKSKPLP